MVGNVRPDPGRIETVGHCALYKAVIGEVKNAGAVDAGAVDFDASGSDNIGLAAGQRGRVNIDTHRPADVVDIKADAAGRAAVVDAGPVIDGEIAAAIGGVDEESGVGRSVELVAVITACAVAENEGKLAGGALPPVQFCWKFSVPLVQVMVVPVTPQSPAAITSPEGRKNTAANMPPASAELRSSQLRSGRGRITSLGPSDASTNKCYALAAAATCSSSFPQRS